MSTAVGLKKAIATLVIRVKAGPHSGDSFTPGKEVFTIGRGAENDIILINDPKLSRQHVRVKISGFGVDIECLNARNPIYYQGEYINRIHVNKADQFQIGETEIEMAWEGELSDKTEVVAPREGPVVNGDKTQIDSNPPELFEDVVSPKDRPKSQVVMASKPLGPPIIDFKQAEMQKSPALKMPTPDLIPISPKTAVPTGPQYVTPSNPRPAPGQGNGGAKSPGSIQRNKKKKDSMPFMLPMILLLIVAIPMFLLNQDKPKKPTRLKDMAQLSSELEKSAQTVDEYLKSKGISGEGNLPRQAEAAQAYYIKGFRDYRQGQFGRAITSFQATLSFDPNHVLARRYLNQSLKKESQLIQFSLDQARRYRDKSNYRLCKGSAQIVLQSPSLQPSDKLAVEAKKLFTDCDLLSKGRF